jgi:lipopolysaccharide/colanic/teichoic acid biosynthesis glycosyltransferase
VNGRNDLPWDARFAADVWYVQNLAFGLDLRILLLTVLKVLRRQNARTVPHLSLRDLDQERG